MYQLNEYLARDRLNSDLRRAEIARVAAQGRGAAREQRRRRTVGATRSALRRSSRLGRGV